MGAVKAADIQDRDFLAAVAEIQRIGGSWANWRRSREYGNGEGGIMDRFPEVPEKVMYAKARRLLKRELMTGCACGCRGGFELTPSGRDLLKER